MNKGFIKIQRKIVEWEWYDDYPCFRLFICLLFAVNWEDKKWHGLTIKRGEMITSLNHLVDITKLTKMQVRTAIKKLTSTGEIVVESTNKFTKVIIPNYSKYQDNNTQITHYDTDKQYNTEETQHTDNKQITFKQHSNNIQITPTKEYKELKEVKEVVIDGQTYNINDPNRPLTKNERKELGLNDS